MAVKTLTMGPGTLTIGEVGTTQEFASQLTSCRFTPTADKGDPINVLSGEQVAGDRTESFTISGTLVQDFGDATGLTEFCWTNRGVQLPFVFMPNTAAGRQVSGDLVVEAVEIGGDVKTKPTSDFTFDVVGTPQIGAAA